MTRRLLGVTLIICLALGFTVIGVKLSSYNSPTTVPSSAANFPPSARPDVSLRSADPELAVQLRRTAGALLQRHGRTADLRHARLGLPQGHRWCSAARGHPRLRVLPAQPEHGLLPAARNARRRFQADTNDAFVGGLAGRNADRSVRQLLRSRAWAIDSNSTNGNQPGVTIEYLTIEKYHAGVRTPRPSTRTPTPAGPSRYNTVTLNVPGAGIFAGADNTIKDNCLTLNGQYGFQSSLVNPWAPTR